MYRDTILKIDVNAIKHNVKALKYISNKEVIGVIKANGYGIGSVALAKILISEKINLLAVSSLDEALELRNNGIKTDIIVLGYTSAKYFNTAIKHNIILTVNSLDFVYKLSSLDPINLRVHIKIDTKMNRIGFKTISDFNTALQLLLKLQVKVEGIFTHYTSSDSDDNSTTAQYLKFEEFVKSTDYKFKYIHASNSDAALHFKKEKICNTVRAGIGLLGYATYNNNLIPSLQLTTKVSQINHLNAGETVSYNATYTAQDNETVATLPIGYADGLIRKNQGRKVFINNEYAEIIGRICMDQMIIKTKVAVQVDDEVEIFGKNINIFAMAKELDTIVYEIIVLLSSRIERQYYENNQITKIYQKK